MTMTTDENIMEEMLGRATNPARETVDELGLQMFCMIVRSNLQLVEKAQKMIIAKIRSTDVTEATRAIALLEECMTKCGSDFQDEASKFRFLNQLITLVSKKHQGGETPTPIKQRLMDCLLLWTTEFPDKNKIREVYDMLKKEGGIEHGNTPAAVAKRESIFRIDEEMLDKLIKSGDPENFKRANLLIQHRVNQETQRTTLLCQYKGVLREVQNTVDLLNQMLDTYENDVIKDEFADGGGEADTVNLIRELFMACKNHKPLLQRLPELIGNTDDALVADTFEVNDLLLAVMKRYKNTIVHPTTTKVHTSTTTATTTTSATKTSSDLLAELLEDTQLQPTTTSAACNDSEMLQTSSNSAAAAVAPLKTAPAIGLPAAKQSSVNTLDELHEIFSDVSNVDSTTLESNKNLNEIFANINLLEPINVFNATSAEKNSSSDGGGMSEKRSGAAFRELPEIDQLSAELFKQSLPMNDRVSCFKKEPEKFTLNELVKEKMNVKPSISPTTPTKTKPEKTDDDRIMANKIDSVETATKHEDDLMLTTTEDEKEAAAIAIENNKIIFNLATGANVKHLSEISIDLDDVTPNAEERLLLDDDDMKLTLNFTADRPSKYVSVIVISACNKCKLPVKDFQFEASVKKPCKVRLLSPTDSSMLPYKPFRPATPINQVMLLLNPTGAAVDITCIVGYKLGDDPDATKESIVVKNIPYVE